jgi:hypothetical protein
MTPQGNLRTPTTAATLPICSPFGFFPSLCRAVLREQIGDTIEAETNLYLSECLGRQYQKQTDTGFCKAL